MTPETGFCFEAIAELCDLNQKLLKLTGIDFGKELTNLANNEKKTEIDARAFIKENYPIKKDLSEQNLQDVSLLLDFYLYQVEYHDNESEATFGYCEERVVVDDKPFRSRCLSHFLTNPKKLEFTTGFFPKD